MTKPSWRNWFSRYTHAALFAMRGLFALVARLLKLSKRSAFVKYSTTLVNRSLSAIKSTVAKWRRGAVISIIAASVFCIGLAVFFVATAKAEKEVHAYISPSYVTSEGVENAQAVTLQDLSIDARISDFSPELSARVAFGQFEQSVKESVQNDQTASSTNTATTTEATPATTTPAVMTEETPVAPAQTAPASSASTTESQPISFLKKLFGVKQVIAQEAPLPEAPAETASEATLPTVEPSVPDSQVAPAAEAVIPVEQTAPTETASADTPTATDTPTTTSNPAPRYEPEDRDAFKIASCTTFGKDCHMMVLEGFGVGSELSKYPVRNAQLMLSLAGRALPQDTPDRVVVRAYHNGRWDYLGEQIVHGEFDNAMRGGYLTFPLAMDSWSELADMIVAIEYVREGESDAVMLLDAAWVDVGFAAEESPDDLALFSPNVKSALLARDAERRARERDHLDLGNGVVVDFTNTMSDLPSSKLRVATTKSKHAVLGSGEEYVAVTNFSSSPEKVRLSFHFPEDGGRVTEIARYTHNAPHKVVESKTSPIAYFCAGGWSVATSTDDVVVDTSYVCPETSEPHVCSSLSEDKTNCLGEITAIGQQEDTVYRRDFEPDAVFSGSFRDGQSIFGKAIDTLLADMPSDILPTSVREVSYSNPFDIEPGTTQYFRVGFVAPLNTRGDIYVEAVAASGSYGLAHTEFDGSWNWRIPVDIGLPYAIDGNEVAVPIVLDKMPQEFWQHVEDNGADIRFSDEDATIELPFWVADFNKITHKGLVWVRTPQGAGIMPRIFLYAGNQNALPVDKPWAPFATATLTPRATLIGKSGEDVSVQVTALAPQVRVAVGDGEERTLLFGETALFENVANASLIKATGPIAAEAHSVFARATVAPFGAAAVSVGIPDGTLELAVTSAQAESGTVSVGSDEYELASGSVFRTPTIDKNKASSSIPALFLSEEAKQSTLLEGSDIDERMQFSASIVLDSRADGVRGLCQGDRYFGAYDIRGGLLATSSCNAVLSGPFDEGSIFRVFGGSTSTPFAARFTALIGGNERTLIGRDSNARSAAGFDPEVAFGEPEYVIPGEHRLFDLEANKERAHITRFLSKTREFAADELPTFRFQYKPQSSGFFRTLRSLVGMSPFTVEEVIIEQAGQPIDIKTTIEYGGNFEWLVKLSKEESQKIAPGALTLRMKIKEGTSHYEDAYDFYWGLLAVNFNKAVYERGETAEISLGALSPSGNTVCDARLKLFVTNSASSTQEVPVSTSGKCDGNNVVDVPDYTAKFTPVDEGDYAVRLIRLDEQENVLAEVRDSFKVVNHQTYIIERSGPTRINPTAPYSMTLRVVAREDFEGTIAERIPADFEIIERGGSTLEWADDAHTAKNAIWNVNLKAGEVYQYTYKFDAPDKSPFIYFLGPAKIGTGETGFAEPRQWMIASDVAGNMLIYWDGGTTPTGWTCVSCLSTDPFYQRYPMGSSTPSVNGGAVSHTHSLTTSVGPAIDSPPYVLVGGTTNLTLAYYDHVHAFTPTFAVGSNLPPSTSLRILRSNAVGEVQMPAGAILMFESAPSGSWSTYSTLNGYFPYGDSGIFNSQGAATHNHAITGTLGVHSGGPLYRGVTYGFNPYVANNAHRHVLNATATQAQSDLPPYATYLMGKSSVLGPTPNGAIAMWDNDPAAGWVNLSDGEGVLANRFVRVDTSVGATGGASEHMHPDIFGATTGTANSSTRSQSLTGAFGSHTTHTHTVDFTSISTVQNLPPFRTVVFAKRSVGISEFTQTDFRFYDNVNDPLPTDPWPANEVDLPENGAIEDVAQRIRPGSILRVRMSAEISNATSTIGTNPIKLQYSTDGVCASALNWNDVGAPGSSAPLRGYDNTLVANGATLDTGLLSTSTPSALQYYSESSTATNFVRNAGIGEIAEFDWVLNANTTLASSSRYCLRMVEASGKPFGSYTKYPSFLTNSAPDAPVAITPFAHAKVLATPAITFAASDEEGNPMHYAIEIDDDVAFGSPAISYSTANAAAHFTNLTNPSNKAPYTNGDTVQYQVQSALSVGTTYWWRVRAMDPTGSTQYGTWSAPRAFTVAATLPNSAWYQTTDAQFVQNALSGVTVSGNAARLAVGSTTATMFSPEVVFNDGGVGTVWGSLVFTDDGGSGITYQVEYPDEGGNWIAIPDSVLANNSVGFGTSPVDLKTIDPNYYPTIRLRANFTNSGTPVLSDWGINWAFKTLAPVLYSQFNHAKTSTTTPTFTFASIDPQSYDITYQFQYSTDPTFAASTTLYSNVTPAAFKNLTNGADTQPFTSGDTVQVKIQTPLTNGTTYFWRARGYGNGAGGAWSFLSDTRAFTVDTSAITYPTWFQSVRGQWNMDTLSGAYANTANSVAVATTSDRVLVAYGKGVEDKPKYRFYEAGVLSGEKSLLSIGSSVLWTVAKTSLINDQYVVGTMGANRAVKFQIFENGVWSRLLTLVNSSPSAQRRSFDVAYETQSGKAVAVACSGTDAVYAVFNGSTWGDVQTLDLPFTTNCELVKMASSPTQNQIIALFRNTGSSYHAEVWNGTQWNNGSRMDFSTAAGTDEPSHDTMAIEYDRGTGRALAVVSTRSTTVNGFRYRVWSGNNWGTEGGVTTLGERAAISKLEWAQLRRNPNSDTLMLCGISQYSTTDDGAYTDFIQWTSGSPGTFAANKLGEFYPLTRHAQSMDCAYETKTGRAGRLLYVADESWTSPGDSNTTLNRSTWDSFLPTAGAWQSGIATTDRRWDASGTTYNWSPNETWTMRVERASFSGDILAIGLTRNTLNYIFRMWNGSTWSSPVTVAGSSVTTRPYGQPFDMSAQQGLTFGHVFSEPINFADGNAPSWREARFAVTKPINTNVLVSVEYLDGNDWVRIPDSVLPGNSVGTTTSPINLRDVNSQTYDKIRLRADLDCSTLASCPTLNDWTVEWTEGLSISGIARAANRTTPITSGTVKIAVNGVEQIGKTGTIDAAGNWTISGVNYKTGETVTAWIDNPGAANRAVAVVKFAGAGSLANVELSRKWLTLGDGGQAGQTISNADLRLFDNNNEAGTTRADIFFNADASENLTLCNTGNCADFSLAVVAGTTWRPKATGTSISSMYSFALSGSLTGDANTLKVAGDWRNAGAFIPGTSHVIFNATSSTHVINSDDATLAKFNNVTFGEAATTALWQLTSPIYMNGHLVVNYGTLQPLADSVSVEGNLTIGANGKWTKGTATTTFLGSDLATWSDNTASGQDIGNVLVDGSPKQLSLSTSVKATNIEIAPADTLSFTVNTLTLAGNFVNNGIVAAGSGKLVLAPLTTASIEQGGYALNNITLTSGTVTWVDTVASSTGDVLINGATVNFPTTSFAVAGNFNQTSGSFTAPSTMLFNATSPGKQIGVTSSFANIGFIGTGAWAFTTNATSTGNVSLTAGTLTMPAGTLAVSGNFVNSGANINANNGVLRMNGVAKNITLNNAQLAGVSVSAGASVSFTDTHATTTGSVITDVGGTLNFPVSGSLGVGGSLINNGTMNANASTLYMNRTSGAATLQAAGLVLSSVQISGNGIFSVIGNTRVSANFTLLTVGGFTMESGRTLQVDGFFVNGALNANTTWTGSTLRLTSGATMSANTKTNSGDDYANVILDGSTQLRLWNSSIASVTTNATSGVYAQNWAGVSGVLRIFGTYTQNSGVAYWDYAKDFDGTALAAGSERQVAVTVDNNAVVSFATSSALEMIGSSGATTTVGSGGTFTLTLASSTLSSRYASVRGMKALGMNLTGGSVIAQLDDTEFTVDTNTGAAMTLSRETIIANAGKQFSRDTFNKGAVATAKNVNAVGAVTTSYVRFKQHSGSLAGELNGNDPGGNPGEVRWDDSSYVISVSGTIFTDDGTTEADSSICDGTPDNVTVKVSGGASFTTSCNSDGTYTVPGVTFSGEVAMTIYLSGIPAKGVVVTRGAANDLSGINIYVNRVIVRHEDALAMNIAKMSDFDADNDADVLFTANSGLLNIPSAYGLFIWGGKTFTPGGNVMTGAGGPAVYGGRVHIGNAAIYNAQASEQITVGGIFRMEAGAQFNAASSTVILNPTDSRPVTLQAAGATFYNLRIAGSGTNTISQPVTVQGNMEVESGTLNGSGSITVLGNATGNGTLNLSGGSNFSMPNGGLFGGDTSWTLRNFTLNNSATTTKNGVGTTTVGVALNVGAGHTFDLAGKPLVLTGANNSLVVNGQLNTDGATVTYAPTAPAIVANIPYFNLSFGGTSTSTLPIGTLVVNGNMTVGGGASTPKVTAATNNTTIRVGGNVSIASGARFVASASGPLSVAGSWLNAGTFVHALGTVNFVGSGTKTVDSGGSPFGSVNFSDSSGIWTLTQNATATNLLIGSSTSWTLASGRTLEVTGSFRNLVGGANTTWTGSTLYLNTGTRDEVNPKTSGNDIYNQVRLGAGTQAVFWNSSSTAFVTAAGSGVLSQNHGEIEGDLYIFGNYVKSSGSEYWDYYKDFDGEVLDSGKLRAPRVLFANGASANYSGSSVLEIVGVASATTTVRSLSGTYGLTIGGASTTMQYADFSNMSATGLTFANTVKVGQMDDVVFRNPSGVGTMMTVPASVINANPLLANYRNAFIASGGNNVTVTGAPNSAWWFRYHYGGRDGEAYDVDPAGNPGYAIWDDSIAMITISGKFLNAAGSAPSAACNGVSQFVSFKLSSATGGLSSACSAADGSFSFGPMNFSPGDKIVVYASSSSGVKSATYSFDPAISVWDMNLYENTVTVRNEQSAAITNAHVDFLDKDQDGNIPARVTAGAMTLDANTKLLLWDGKKYAPGGNVTVFGDVELRQGAVWQTSGAAQYSIGGSLLMGNNAETSGGAGEFIFTATTGGKVITATTPATLPNVRFNGLGGSWTMSGVATTTGNLQIQQGSVVLPNTALSIGGDFNNLTTFDANGGTLLFAATSSGKQIRSSGSSFGSIVFTGTGSWDFLDNATTTGSFVIASGTPKLPAGVLSVNGDFENIAGAFNANGGSIVVRGSGSRKIVPGASAFNNLRIENGDYTTNMMNATSTGNVIIASGSLQLPTADFAIGGTFQNYGSFNAGATSTVRMFATSTGKIINPGASSFNNLVIDGVGGGFTLEANATTTKALTLKNASQFVVSGGVRVAVQDLFTNLIGGTWNNAGTTLRLERMGTSTVNLKTSPSATYANLELGENTQINLWNSSATNVMTATGASLYSMRNAGVNGALNIYGNYVRTTGSDYWSSLREFDGTSIAARTVNVNIANGATVNYQSGAELHIAGGASNITNIQALGGSGTFGLSIDGGVFEGKYLKLRNIDANGLQLVGDTTIVSFDNADLAASADNARMVLLSVATVERNTGALFTGDSFASGGFANTINVSIPGTTGNSVTFTEHTGLRDGEAYDEDDGANVCGAIRWDDSSCQFIDQRYFRWRNDDGGEAVPDSEWMGGSVSGWPYRQRVHIVNNATSPATNVAVKVVLDKRAEMQSTFQDIRFTLSDGTTTVPFWLEEYPSDSAKGYFWVKVPQLNAKSSADLYAYYGNASASSASNGSGVFDFFYDAETGLSGWSGDTSGFTRNSTDAYNAQVGTNSLKASNVEGMTVNGMANTSAGAARGRTFREKIYLDTSVSDDACLTFGVNASDIKNNWAYCVSPNNQNSKKVRIVKNAFKDGLVPNATEITTADPASALTTGWYDVRVDWETSGLITATLRQTDGTLVNTITAQDVNHTPGSGVGFTYWYQHGAWENITATPFLPGTPSVIVLPPQSHSGATWKAPENVAFMTANQNSVMRLRFGIRNTGTLLNDQQLRLNWALKGTKPNCESVLSTSYTPVPVATNCGLSPVCMSTSTNFADNDATTPLLSTPKGLNYTQGRMVESPSNATPGYSIPSNTFTEVEYAMTFTSYAAQPGYCFRVTNDDDDLVSYTKVAEAAVLQPPRISGWNWTVDKIILDTGVKTRVSATGTVSDSNGAADIVSASGAIYHNGGGRTASCTQDENNCYSASTTCALDSCSGLNCMVSCYADLQYFAEPAMSPSPDRWVAQVTVKDSQNMTDVDSAPVELWPIIGIALDKSSLDYGEVEVGTSTASAKKISLTNTGNVDRAISIDGSNLTASGSMIPVSYQGFATSSFGALPDCAICTALAETSTDVDLFLPKPISTTPVSRDLYFGIFVPNGTKAVEHGGVVNITARMP